MDGHNISSTQDNPNTNTVIPPIVPENTVNTNPQEPILQPVITSIPVAITQPAPKKSKKIWWMSLGIVLLIIVIGGVGAFVGIKGRDWLRQQEWYVCFRNGKCTASNTNTVKQNNVDISRKDQSFSAPADVSDLYEKVNSGVVSIVLEQKNTSGEVRGENAIASGFIIDAEEGLIITNDHVVCTTGDYKIVTKDNKVFPVTKIERDSADDLALLKVDVSKNKLPMQLSFAKDSNQVRPGQFVVAVGNPLGEFPGSVSTGVISGTRRSVSATGLCNGQTVRKDYDDVFQTDASINPGNSGGPLLNINGDVIGVNSATSQTASGISFSIPVNRVIRKVDEFKKNGRFQNPYLGVKYIMIDENDALINELPVKNGAYISDVMTGTPAEKAALKKGDIIIKFDNVDVKFSLQTLISSKRVGEDVTIVVKRKDESGKYNDVSLTITLAELPIQK